MNELQDLTALIRANTPLIVVETQDEARAVEDKPPLTPDEAAAWLNAYRPTQSTRQETTTP